jgi:CHAD domain-containing protein
MSQTKSKSRDPVAEAYHGLAPSLFAKASAACDRLGKEDDEALHDFRVALRRLRTHLATHRDHFGKRRADKLRKRLGELVSATNLSRDYEVQRDWIERQIHSDTLSPSQREGLGLILTEFCGNGPNGANLMDPAPIRQHFAEIGERFRKRRWSVPEHGGSQDAPIRSVSVVTQAALREHAAKLRGQLNEIDSVDSVRATHRARLAVKRLRYILEPLSKAIPEARDVIVELKAMQDTLGALRDLQILQMQIALAVGFGSQVGELSADESPAFEPMATPASSPSPSQTTVLEDQARKALEAGLDYMRFEAQREFNGLRERWLDGRAESLVQRIEHIADALQASRATQ